MWHELVAQQDIEKLMDSYDYFHDGCMVHLEYSSGVYVDEDLSMCFDSTISTRMIFQRQDQNPKTIELLFEGVTCMGIYSEDIGNALILDASMFFFENKIFWFDKYGVKAPIEDYKGVWICAEKARWRIVD